LGYPKHERTLSPVICDRPLPYETGVIGAHAKQDPLDLRRLSVLSRPGIRMMVTPARIVRVTLALVLILVCTSIFDSVRQHGRSTLERHYQHLQEQVGLHACSGWDPDQPAELDNRGCHRATQYRQLERFTVNQEILHG
jgi:hypothetical protein